MITLFDTETTGLLQPGTATYDRAPGITQIAALKLDNDMNEIEEPFNEYVDPEINPLGWEEKAIEITGINPDMVKSAPSFMTIGLKFANYVLGSHTLAGYNIIGFDVPVLAFQLERYGLKHHFPWPPNHYDVMHVAKQYFNLLGKRGTKNPKLGEAYKEIFGKTFDNAHDALADIRATAAVMKEVKNGTR